MLALENKESSIFPCSRLALAVGKFKTVFSGDRKRPTTMDYFISRPLIQSQATTDDTPNTHSVKPKKKKDLTAFFPILPRVRDT